MRKKVVVIPVLVVAAGLLAISKPGAMPMFWGSPAGGEGSPALAALLSLAPVPAALGQFYAGDWKAGLAFSFLETAEVAAASVVFAYERVA